ncbi:MAG: type IV pilus biogenesis protein PilP [Alphaproteobacteria bacterium]|nr:type IV pilus biogenesis protein PilP [Alphaproteobacteria bacterium]
MKIANNSFKPKRADKKFGVAVFAAFGILSLLPAEAYAMDASVHPAVASPVTAAPLATPSLAAAPSALVVPSVPAKEASSANSIPASQSAASGTEGQPASPIKAQGSEIEKSMAAMENKVTESAKNEARSLDTNSKEVTFADLNAARQTITRIEAMIDIEKRLIELEKLKKERSGAYSSAALVDAKSLAGAVPASALTPMPPISRSHKSESGAKEQEDFAERNKNPVAAAPYELSRIYGVNGKYMAVLKSSGNKSKTVRVGDRISDGSTVTSITESSVTIGGRGNTHTLNINSVDAIYSAMR